MSSQYKKLSNSGDIFIASVKGLTYERLDSVTGQIAWRILVDI